MGSESAVRGYVRSSFCYAGSFLLLHTDSLAVVHGLNSPQHKGS